MKTFLNVLYRRILYKIPLKLLLVLIAVFGILFACFSNALTIIPDYSTYFSFFHRAGSSSPVDISPAKEGITCVEIDGNGNSNYYLDDGNDRYYFSNNWQIYCTNSTNLSLYINTTYYYWFFFSEELFRQFFPNYTSMQCQTEYNLIPISSVDQNYCTTNNLCPSQECPDIPVWTGEYSQLYINNILHLGAPNIIMNIPDEIDWDYAYTQGGQNMNIDVVGYNVDYEKIDQIVQLQNYKPTSEDFQKIIGLLTPYTKIIVFFVFLFIVWAWIKKPFKSKKL